MGEIPIRARETFLQGMWDGCSSPDITNQLTRLAKSVDAETLERAGRLHRVAALRLERLRPAAEKMADAVARRLQDELSQPSWAPVIAEAVRVQHQVRTMRLAAYGLPPDATPSYLDLATAKNEDEAL